MAETLRTIKIELPFAPPSELSPNARVHWAVKAKKAREMRDSGYNHAIMDEELDEHLQLLDPMERAKITFTFYKAGRVDEPNLTSSMKSWVDGLVDAGLFKDDDYKHMTSGEHSVVRCKRKDESTVILIEELA